MSEHLLEIVDEGSGWARSICGCGRVGRLSSGYTSALKDWIGHIREEGASG